MTELEIQDDVGHGPPEDDSGSAFEQIPNEMRALDQWVVWRYVVRDGKRTKQPFNARSGKPASATDPATWSSFEQAVAMVEWDPHYGLGFVFRAGGGIYGFDADHVRDPTTGAIEPEAEAWPRKLNTYTEVSPSGTGIHAIGFGTLPGPGKKRAPFEVYDQGRFFTVTGNRLPDYPPDLTPASEALAELWHSLAKDDLPDAPPPPTDPGRSALTDDEVIERASAAANGPKFRALWSGDPSGHGDDDSSADLALCNILAFWCRRDAEQMDRLFRRSGLMRSKWDDRRGRSTWGANTIAEAIRITRNVYEGGSGGQIRLIKGRRTNIETGEVLTDAADRGGDHETTAGHATAGQGGGNPAIEAFAAFVYAVIQGVEIVDQHDRSQPWYPAWCLAGLLLQAGLTEQQVETLLLAVGERFPEGARDAMRWDSAAATTEALREKGKDSADEWMGGPTLIEAIGATVVNQIVAMAFVPFPREGAGTLNPKLAGMGADFGLVRPRRAERPPFPLEALGSPTLEAMAREGAAAVRCPLDFTATALLGACSVAVAGAVQLHIMNTFRAYPAIWACLVGEPGTGKGPAYDLAIRALEGEQSGRYASYLDAKEQHLEALADWRASDRRIRGPEPQPPMWRPAYGDDLTLEALVVRLEAGTHGLGILHEELAGWLRGQGQYKRTSNDREQWLRIYDCRAITVERKTDGVHHIARPVVPILGTTQPAKIARLLSSSDDGLRERLTFCYPEDTGPQPLEEVPPLQAEADYSLLIRALLALDGPVPQMCALTKAARREWTGLERLHCEDQHAIDFDPALRPSYAKARGLAARLTCLLHVVRALDPRNGGDGTIPGEVPADVVRDGWSLTTYYLDHAAALFHENGRGDARIDRAVRWLEQRGGEAKLRDMARAKLAGTQSAVAAKKLAEALEDRGLVRIVTQQVGGETTTVVALATLEAA